MANEQGEEESRKKIVLILIGPPASGKSTFCHKLIDGARRPWTRICQDIISNGKRGSKAQCVSHALEALKKGESVLIDRCNLTKEQRYEFVQLQGPSTDVHAVALDLPVKICISRIANRTGHEGGLQGGKAAAAVNRMLQTKEEPSLSEGFYRITHCQTEADVESILNVYRDLGPNDVLPSGTYGQKKKDCMPKGSILSFLKKGKQDCISGSKSVKQECDPDKSLTQPNLLNSLEKTEGKCDPEVSSTRKAGIDSVQSFNRNFSNSCIDDLGPTLAFPSISTSDFRFDHEKAADIIVEKVSEFLVNFKTLNPRLALVDLSDKSDMLSRVRAKATERELNSRNFLTLAGDITTLNSKQGFKCDAIANAANWRLKAGGGGVNAAIFKAAGPEFEVVTKEFGKVLDTGKALVVPLPKTSPLHTKEGITYVIHVVGPNMNPQRPNCLDGDYVKGCELLRDTYTSLFQSFAELFIGKGKDINSKKQIPLSVEPKKQSESKSLIVEMKPSSGKNAFSMLMEASKKSGGHISCKKTRTEDSQDLPVSKKLKTDTECKLQPETAIGDIEPVITRGSKADSPMLLKGQCTTQKVIKSKVDKFSASWAQDLYNIAFHPEEHKSAILECMESTVVIYDRYPKAKKHILVIARLDVLDCIANVGRQHLDLLREMHSVGMRWSDLFLQEDTSLIFRLGYHSVPSMRQLHLHVISQDFDSPHLKNKKHWNSFTTSFFKDSVDVIEEIEKHGKVKIDAQNEILSMELRCHRCRSVHPNIPRLKTHISTCKSPFPEALSWGKHLISHA